MRGCGRREGRGEGNRDRETGTEAKAEREGGGLEPPPQTEKGIQSWLGLCLWWIGQDSWAARLLTPSENSQPSLRPAWILRSGSISNLRCVPNACWIHLSPSTLSLRWTIHLHNWTPSPALTPLLLPPFFPECRSLSLSLLSFLTSLTFAHWSLCHFLNNDPGAEGTTAYLYFITVRPSSAGLGDQAV